MTFEPLQSAWHPQILAHRQRLSDTNADAAPLLSLYVLRDVAERRKLEREKRRSRRKKA